MNKKKNSDFGGGIVLLAKRAGRTSFSSLSDIKRALGTTKVGHTGTLDSFADGLLVVLCGNLTHLVSHITAFDKEYLAVVEFGKETDTLDPTGKIVSEGRIPSKEEVLQVLPKFIGEIEQTPPLFSAVHIGGKRASSLAREGKTVEIAARKVKISSIKLVDFLENRALIRVCCSKGTYIRSLGRDIARALGTVAHLAALRRTRVGNFRLEDAAGAKNLPEFRIKADVLQNQDSFDESEFQKEILSCTKPFDFSVAEQCGIKSFVMSPYFAMSFSNGKPIFERTFKQFFLQKNADSSETSKNSIQKNEKIAVFYPKNHFAGIIRKDFDSNSNPKEKRFAYEFAVPFSRKLAVFSWEDVAGGKFPSEFKEKGTALTIGSFDGPHIGHDALFDDVLLWKKRGFCAGVVTFTRSLRGMKIADYSGDIATLSQRHETFLYKGFDFAVVIDFSDEFGKIEGSAFLKMLCEKCGMRHLAEGKDFHCGYKGAVGMEEIALLSQKEGFSLSLVSSVMYCGERVSSSRVRDCILSADFESSRIMLDRYYSLDCEGFGWQREGDFLFAEVPTRQVIPPSNSYKVLVILQGKNRLQSGEAQSSVTVRAFRSDCIIASRKLRLPLCDELIGGNVRAIQFGYPDENIL